jgi:hypothetical protein
MPEFHDVFWRSLFANLDHLLDLFTFLFGEKVKNLSFEQSSCQTGNLCFQKTKDSI